MVQEQRKTRPGRVVDTFFVKDRFITRGHQCLACSHLLLERKGYVREKFEDKAGMIVVVAV